MKTIRTWIVWSEMSPDGEWATIDMTGADVSDEELSLCVRAQLYDEYFMTEEFGGVK